jgi:peptidoglycan/xylan/chitin deacetylase (PgdA/CDA1 family)
VSARRMLSLDQFRGTVIRPMRDGWLASQCALGRDRTNNVAKALLFHSGIVGKARELAPGPSALPILAYHSVSNPSPYRRATIAVRPDLFDRQMAYLAAHYRVLTLDEVVERIAVDQRFPHKAVAITFDDGYLDNYEIALPILRKHGLTATFFLSTGPVLQGDAFWVGWLHTAITCTRRLPLLIARLGIEFEPHGNTRENVHVAIAARLNRCGARERRSIYAEIDNILDDVPSIRRPSEFMMRAEHVRELSRAGMLIGSHTVSHPILSEIGEGEALSELLCSKRDLEGVIDKRVDHLAYPNGPGVTLNFNGTVRRLARHAGYRSASTSIRGVVRPRSDPYQLPRQSINEPLGFTGFAFKLEEHRFPWLLRNVAAPFPPEPDLCPTTDPPAVRIW